MWCASVRTLALAALVVGAAGCGPRRLDIALTIDGTGCNLSVPAGGSVLYEVQANGTIDVDGGGGSFCGGCLAVDGALSGSDQVVAFLRANAPSCGGVHPDTSLRIRVTGWSVAGCPQQSTAQNFCAEAPSQLVPDGTSSSTLTMNLACMQTCSSVCVATTCAAQGKNCGLISDGCNAVLDCGTCKPPLKCGVTTPNVCGR